MYINTFKYSPKDVSCQLCTEYVKKLGCTALRCPWLAERIEAGHGQRRAVQPSFFTYSVQSWQLTSLGVYLNVLIYMGASFWHENSGQTNCLSAQRL